MSLCEQKRQKAQHLLDKVYDQLELVEKDYFGLQFMDTAPAEDGLVIALPVSSFYALVCL